MTLARRRRHSWPFKIARLLPTVFMEQPWAIFIKSLCIVSGITTFFGPQPGSVVTVLPRQVVFCWSVTLVAGASCALWGLVRPKQRGVELAGLIWLGTASIVYAGTIYATLGLPGILGGTITLAFGLFALVRALAVYVSYEIALTAAST